MLCVREPLRSDADTFIIRLNVNIVNIPAAADFFHHEKFKCMV